MKTSTLLIRTPEGIVFSQQLAGPVTRFLAWLVDTACVVALTTLCGTVLAIFRLISPDLGAAAATIAWFGITLGYSITLEWAWRGQTVGKKLFRLRVVDVEGMRLQFNQVVIRNLLRFVDALPFFYAVGGMVCWFSPRCQRLGDIVANTVVLRLPSISEPDLDQLLGGKFNSLRQYPHLAARLRQRVAPGEAAVALQAVLRREEFEPAARVQLFACLAEHFHPKVRFPQEAVEGLADEQYLRNVIDVVYRGRSNWGEKTQGPRTEPDPTD